MHLVPANDPTALASMQAKVRSEHEARAQHAADEARRGRGVSYSGLTGGLYAVPSPPVILAEARNRLSVNERFAKSSRGRFLTALRAIREAGVYAFEAERARSAYDRGFGEENAPISTHEIGVALEALAAVIGSDAAEARQALAELLMLPTKAAA